MAQDAAIYAAPNAMAACSILRSVMVVSNINGQPMKAVPEV